MTEEQIKQNASIPTDEIEKDIKDTQDEIDSFNSELKVLKLNPVKNRALARKVVKNTLRMMGVSGMKAVFFADALQLFPLTINKEVKQGMIDTMLNTQVMDKTFREWFEHFVKEGNKRGVVYEFVDVYNQPQSRPYTTKDFDFARIEKPNIMLLIEMVLREFYKKEKVMG